MASKVFANEDLKRHIFSFGYPEHRTLMRGLIQELQLDMSLFPDHGSITDQVGSYDVLEQLKWFDYLNRCRCCSRHSHYKPYILGCEGIYPVNMGKIPEGNVIECKCPCRSFARYFLIGMIDDTHLRF